MPFHSTRCPRRVLCPSLLRGVADENEPGSVSDYVGNSGITKCIQDQQLCPWGTVLMQSPPLHAYVTLHPMSVEFCLCMCAYVACAQIRTREDTRVRSEHTCISHGVFTKRLCCDAVHTPTLLPLLFRLSFRARPDRCRMSYTCLHMCRFTESVSTRHLRAPTRIVSSRRVEC